MSKIRVLVVDDSVVIRRLVTDILTAEPDIEVAGFAANGRIALKKISEVNPDLVTLDVEIPDWTDCKP
jgi:two-component system, chemotaxis family, protein-glutamate methylesterase/glutaminase